MKIWQNSTGIFEEKKIRNQFITLTKIFAFLLLDLLLVKRDVNQISEVKEDVKHLIGKVLLVSITIFKILLKLFF